MVENGVKNKILLFTMRVFFCGQLAQLVEQWTENPRVRGSIPRLATIFSH